MTRAGSSNSVVRIAHLNFIDEPGVTRKLREQARAAIELGLPIDFYVISANFQDHDEDGLRFRKRSRSPFPGKLRFIHGILFGREDLISDYLDPKAYDFFVIRFGKLFLGQGVTYERWGDRIVTEHHTDEMAELLLKSGAGRRILTGVSARRSARALHLVAGRVGVTREIVDIENRKGGQKPGLLLPNGISVDELDPQPRYWSDGDPLRLIFAAAAFQPWQGLDRLLAGLKAYAGNTRIELELAGRLDEEQRFQLRYFAGHPAIRIIELGLLSPADLCQRYGRCHLGIASLALQRKAMKEACPLKAREYSAWGLPFAYAYDDPDFPIDWPYAFKLPADESAVDIAAIVDFARRLYGKGDPSAAIHAFARECLDWKPKITRLYEFISDLARRS